MLCNLAHREMPLSTQGTLCNTSLEMLKYALFWFSHALATWFHSSCGYKPNTIGFPSFAHWRAQLRNYFGYEPDKDYIMPLTSLALRYI